MSIETDKGTTARRSAIAEQLKSVIRNMVDAGVQYGGEVGQRSLTQANPPNVSQAAMEIDDTHTRRAVDMPSRDSSDKAAEAVKQLKREGQTFDKPSTLPYSKPSGVRVNTPAVEIEVNPRSAGR